MLGSGTTSPTVKKTNILVRLWRLWRDEVDPAHPETEAKLRRLEEELRKLNGAHR